jgi:hypothetical protein
MGYSAEQFVNRKKRTPLSRYMSMGNGFGAIRDREVD